MKPRFVLHFNTIDFFPVNEMGKQAGFKTRIVTVGKSTAILYR